MDASIAVRPVAVTDAEAIARLYAPYVANSVISFELEAPDAQEISRRIKDRIDDYPWLVAVRGNDVIGYAYAGRLQARPAYNWSAEITIYVHQDWHRHGVGNRLYVELLDILRRQGIHSLYACITALPGSASIAFHQKFGFSIIGTFREAGWKCDAWHDVVWMGMTLDSEPPADGSPVLFKTLAALSG